MDLNLVIRALRICSAVDRSRFRLQWLESKYRLGGPCLEQRVRSWEIAALRFQAALLAYATSDLKAGFRADQPRWPAGSGEISGRWSGGPGTASPGDGSLAGSSRGHHFVPRQIYEKLRLREETRRVFQRAVTGPLHGSRHSWSREHDVYNDAVQEHFERFLKEHRITVEEMTPAQAEKVVDAVKRSSDPRIRSFNMRIYMREILYWFRRLPRGNE